MVRPPSSTVSRAMAKRILGRPWTELGPSLSSKNRPISQRSLPAQEASKGEEPSALFRDIHLLLDYSKEAPVPRKRVSIYDELGSIAKYYFDGQGKAIRPNLTLLMSEAVNQHLGIPIAALETQRNIALIAEMYHTASLIHDDVIDKAETRRGKTSVNHVWGQRKSVDAGDYTVALSNKVLAQTRSVEVVQAMSKIIDCLVLGELQQLKQQNRARFAGGFGGSVRTTTTFKRYLDKTFNKTASLMAYSSQSVTLLALEHLRKPAKYQQLSDMAFRYGKNTGIGFQLVDDLLDFTSCDEQLGKPAGADLKLGIVTAPVLFAAEQYPKLQRILARNFSKSTDVEEAIELVRNSNGINETRYLANTHVNAALKCVNALKDSDAKEQLILLAKSAIERSK